MYCASCGALRSTCETAGPSGAIAQLRKRVEKHGVPFQRLHPADLNDDGVAVGCRAARRARDVRFDRRVDHFDAGARLRQRRRREPAVADDRAGVDAPGEPVEPMPAGRHVHPEHERDGMAFRNRAEERERPRLMADDDVGALRLQQRGERAPRAPHRQRARDPRLAEDGDRHARVSQIGGDAAVRRQRHRHVHRWRERPESRERQQERLHPAVQISAMNVQNAHSHHCFRALRPPPASDSSPGAAPRSTAAACPVPYTSCGAISKDTARSTWS